jgi:hypothetical protein
MRRMSEEYMPKSTAFVRYNAASMTNVYKNLHF